MTISKADADALIQSFDSIAGYIADAIDLTPQTGLNTCERLDKLYATLLSMASSSQGVEPYTWAHVVTRLQEAIAKRHVHGR